MKESRPRENMLDKREEAWTPPLMSASRSGPARVLAALRRWFDLQAGSCWSDLKPELAKAREGG